MLKWISLHSAGLITMPTLLIYSKISIVFSCVLKMLSHFAIFRKSMMPTSLYNSMLKWPDDSNLFSPICKINQPMADGLERTRGLNFLFFPSLFLMSGLKPISHIIWKWVPGTNPVEYSNRACIVKAYLKSERQYDIQLGKCRLIVLRNLHLGLEGVAVGSPEILQINHVTSIFLSTFSTYQSLTSTINTVEKN